MPGLRVELGGQMFETGGAPGGTAAIGLLAAVVILLLTFGSVLAMGLPIMIALFGIGTGLSLVAVLSHVLSTPDFTTELASMIGIGVGIDYALFIVTRYRQGLHDGLEPEPAVVLAIDTAGRAVLFAGVTVVISLFGLFLMGVEFVRGLAAGASVTVALVMVASVTLLPAVLGFCGRSIDRLSGAGPPPPRERASREPLVPLEPGRAAPAVGGGDQRPRGPRRAGDSRCSACTWASAMPATTRSRRRPARPTTCSRAGSAPGSTGRSCWPRSLSPAG